LSTLTKILIVLLTISSIFLCGIVVTYVANADNYRQKYNNIRAERDSLSKKVASRTEEVNEKIAEKQELEERLKNEIAQLGIETDQLQVKLNDAEREKAILLQRVNSWEAITADFSKTTDGQRKQFEKTFEELKKIQAEEIKLRKELDETTGILIEKMAIIETLETKNRQLLEKSSELESRLDQLLLPTGEITTKPVPVTPEKAIAKPVKTITEKIALQALVTEVDLKNSLAEISIGKADGVKEGMKFLVTRGDEFICEILIIHVEAEEAVGILERVQYQPKVGDNVSTNL